MAEITEIRSVIRRRLDTPGYRVRTVTEDADAGVAQIVLIDVVAVRLDGIHYPLGDGGAVVRRGAFGAEQGVAVDDAMADVNLVGVQGQLQACHRMHDQSDAVVHRVFGLQRPEAGYLCSRRVGR